MPDDFKFDVFLSHSSKDKPVVRDLARRLDDAPIHGSLAQFLYINWIPSAREQEHAKFLEAWRTTSAMRSLKWPALRRGFSIPSVSPSACKLACDSRCEALHKERNGHARKTHIYTLGVTNVPRF